jgi:hypothetical protein
MRDDFSEDVKRTVAARVGYLCSRPSCHARTTGPQADSTKALNVGVAAHITAASPGGPRYDPSLTTEERRHANNALWLCQNCGKLVDNDQTTFTEGELRQWKKDAEAEALALIGKTEVAPSETKSESILSDWFHSLIAEKTEGFVGRDFVFTAIDKFLAERSNGYFIIEGDPGVGKSAIMAEFVKRTSCVAHFNVLSQGINRSGQFLENVCTQIIERYGLPYKSLPPAATQDGAFFARLLDQASSKLAADDSLLIGVDALDEVDQSDIPTGANILYLSPSLPRGVFFVMTKRPITLPFMTSSPQLLFNLMDYPTQSRQDVETYIRQATSRARLREWIDGRELGVETFINILAEKSENNFMYLRYVLPELERGVYEDLNIEQLPSGLEGYYESHWRRMGMTDSQLPRTKIKIIYVLSEVPLPVSRILIAQVTGEDEMTVQMVLDEWSQFLRDQYVDGEHRYSIYHTSFRDFLHRQDIVQAAGTSIKDINSLISGDFMRELYPTK